jgi:hypothetical protein
MLWHAFQVFKGASGLSCNLNKCQLVPTRCSDEQLQLALLRFPCQASQFTIKYLGIPFPVHKLPKSALQTLVNRVMNKLPPWKG